MLGAEPACRVLFASSELLLIFKHETDMSAARFVGVWLRHVLINSIFWTLVDFLRAYLSPPV
jgi:hypothetical protein